MNRYVILKNIGRWGIYQPDCGRASIPHFSTKNKASKWLKRYLKSYGEWESRHQYLVTTIQWPEPK